MSLLRLIPLLHLGSGVQPYCLLRGPYIVNNPFQSDAASIVPSALVPSH